MEKGPDFKPHVEKPSELKQDLNELHSMSKDYKSERQEYRDFVDELLRNNGVRFHWDLSADQKELLNQRLSESQKKQNEIEQKMRSLSVEVVNKLLKNADKSWDEVNKIQLLDDWTQYDLGESPLNEDDIEFIKGCLSNSPYIYNTLVNEQIDNPDFFDEGGNRLDIHAKAASRRREFPPSGSDLNEKGIGSIASVRFYHRLPEGHPNGPTRIYTLDKFGKNQETSYPEKK